MTQSEEIRTAVLAEKIDAMTAALNKLESKLDSLSTQFLTKTEWVIYKQAIHVIVGTITIAVITFFVRGGHL